MNEEEARGSSTTESRSESSAIGTDPEKVAVGGMRKRPKKTIYFMCAGLFALF